MNEQPETFVERLRSVLRIEIPDSLVAKIHVLFNDGTSSNWDIDNVTYRFKGGPLECPFYPGYYYIPGFSRYVINIHGEMIVVRTSNKMSWGITKPNPKYNITGGYYICGPISDSGHRVSLGRHRALCLTFKDYWKHPDIWVANHLNGVPGDDRLDNLAFCTESENIKHAYDNGLCPNKTRAVDALNWITGEARSFPTVKQCADYLHRPHRSVTSRLTAGNNRRFADGWRIKDRNDVWLPLNKHIGEMVTNVDVVGRDVFANTTYIFGSIADASRATGVLQGTIQRHVKEQSMTPINGWNFRTMKNFEGWPNYTEKHLTIFRNSPLNPRDGVEVHDLKTNETQFFADYKEAAEQFSLSPITIFALARREGTRFHRYKFRLFKIRETLGPLIVESMSEKMLNCWNLPLNTSTTTQSETTNVKV
jgi:hypothetical protein